MLSAEWWLQVAVEVAPEEGAEVGAFLEGEFTGQVVVPLLVTAASAPGAPLAISLFAAPPESATALCGGAVLLHVAPAPADPAASQLTGATLTGAIPAGSSATLTLAMTDRWGNAVPVDPADVTVTLTPL